MKWPWEKNRDDITEHKARINDLEDKLVKARVLDLIRIRNWRPGQPITVNEPGPISLPNLLERVELLEKKVTPIEEESGFQHRPGEIKRLFDRLMVEEKIREDVGSYLFAYYIKREYGEHLPGDLDWRNQYRNDPDYLLGGVKPSRFKSEVDGLVGKIMRTVFEAIK